MNNLSVNTDNYNLFFETMFERHIIWYKRFIEQQTAPYTDDQIFQTTKFTNIYRELDRNTQWEIKNIFFDNTLDLRQMIWKIFFFRIINRIETFETFEKEYGWRHGLPNIEDYDNDIIYKAFADISDAGKAVFTSSYLVWQKPYVGGRNVHYAYTVFPEIVNNIDEIISNLQNAKSANDALKYLSTLNSIGAFVGYQLYIDLTYIDTFSHLHLFDFKKDDAINVGMGSLQGIRLIYPDIERKNIINGFTYLKQVTASEFEKIAKERNIEFPYVAFAKNGIHITNECNITITEIEHWLCEFQKYYGVLNPARRAKYRSKFVESSSPILINVN